MTDRIPDPGPRWTPPPRFKLAVLQRQWFMCVGFGRYCGAPIRDPKHGICDHRIPRWTVGGDSRDPADYDYLCLTCNKAKTAKDAADRGKVKRLRAPIGECVNGGLCYTPERCERRGHCGSVAVMQPGKRKRAIKGRGFDKTKTRHFDGSVTRRGK